MLSHSGAKVILLEDAAQAAKIASVRDALPELEHVIVLTGEAEGAITLADLRARGAADGDDVAARADRGGRPRGRGDDRLHVRHDRPAEGLRALAREPALHGRARTSTAWSMRDTPPMIFQYLPLAHVLARMVSFVAPRHRRHARVLGRRHEEARRGHRRGQADAHPDRPAAAGEDPHARGRQRRRRRRRQGGDLHARAGDRREGGQGQARGPLGQPDRPRPPRRRRQARAVEGPRRARPEQPGPDHRRRADRHRGDRVLLRLRRAGARGLRDDRDVRGRDAEHRRRGRASAASGARCPAPRSRSPTTARS